MVSSSPNGDNFSIKISNKSIGLSPVIKIEGPEFILIQANKGAGKVLPFSRISANDGEGMTEIDNHWLAPPSEVDDTDKIINICQAWW